jgi:hypothetical protein
VDKQSRRHRERQRQFTIDVAALRHGDTYLAAVTLDTAAATWQRVADAMRDPSMELTVETFAGILFAFHRAREAGVTFDPAFVALMSLLRRQCFGTDDDADDDRDYGDEDVDNAGAFPGGAFNVRQFQG